MIRNIVLTCALGVLGLAQTLANLSGRVQDARARALSGVRLIVRNAETGRIRETRTGNEGNFNVPALAVGRYEVRAEMPRFRPSVQRDVILAVGETRNLDLTLEVGSLDQEVTVVGRAPTVNTSTSELSYLVEDAVIRELPLNGRNWTDLALLQPGVIAYPHRDGGSAPAHGLGMSINGQDLERTYICWTARR